MSRDITTVSIINNVLYFILQYNRLSLMNIRIYFSGMITNLMYRTTTWFRNMCLARQKQNKHHSLLALNINNSSSGTAQGLGWGRAIETKVLLSADYSWLSQEIGRVNGPLLVHLSVFFGKHIWSCVRVTFRESAALHRELHFGGLFQEALRVGSFPSSMLPCFTVSWNQASTICWIQHGQSPKFAKI